MSGLITAIAGAAISAGTTAVSFAQANKEKNKQMEYEREADEALAKAREALKVNYAKQMSIKKEPYNAEREMLLSQGAMITEAAALSDRGAAAAAGQVYAGQQGAQANITDRQTDELYNIENAILEEESRLRDVGVSLDMEELRGNQQAAADARLAAQQATQQGIEGIANTATQALSMPKLYSGNRSKTNAAIAGTQAGDKTFLQGYNPETATGRDFRQMKRANPNFTANINYQRYLAGLDPMTLTDPNALVNNSQAQLPNPFVNEYNPYDNPNEPFDPYKYIGFKKL